MFISAAAVPAIDPTALALLSIFGGVAITVVAGSIGAWVQARREQDKWWRERRLQAYTDYLVANDHLFAEGLDDSVGPANVSERANEIRRTIATIHLLGPDSTYEAASAFQTAMLESREFAGRADGKDKERLLKRRAFIEAARKSLS